MEQIYTLIAYGALAVVIAISMAVVAILIARVAGNLLEGML